MHPINLCTSMHLYDILFPVGKISYTLLGEFLQRPPLGDDLITLNLITHFEGSKLFKAKTTFRSLSHLGDIFLLAFEGC